MKFRGWATCCQKRSKTTSLTSGSSANSRDHRQPLSTATWERIALECGEWEVLDAPPKTNMSPCPLKRGHFKSKIVFVFGGVPDEL